MGDFEQKLEVDLPRGVADQRGVLTESKWLDPAALVGPEWGYRDERGRKAGLMLGYREGRVIGSMDNRHVLTVAGSRGGKGVSLIIPNMLAYEGSVVVIDPKGELARITARARRAMGQKVVVVDPFLENGRYASGSLNPLAELDPSSPLVKDDVGQIARSLIKTNDKDPHWGDSASDLIKAVILFVLTLPEAERNLVTVWRLLSTTHPMVREMARRAECGARKALLMLLSGCRGVFDDTVGGTGDRFLEMGERELGSVFSTALTQLEFLDSPAMASVLGSSDVRLSELKTGKTTLYLCLPAMRMETHSRWLRVVINMALIAFEREKTRPDLPVLMVLDEFPVLGHMKSVETAAGLMAGFGVRLWVVLQDLTQIQRDYRESWQTFIGNAGVITAWANTDKATLEYLSEKLGQTSVRLQQSTGATATQRLGGASGVREELRVQRLAAAHELETLLARQTERLLVKAAGRDPVILKRMIYYRDKPFAGLFDE